MLFRSVYVVIETNNVVNKKYKLYNVHYLLYKNFKKYLINKLNTMTKCDLNDFLTLLYININKSYYEYIKHNEEAIKCKLKKIMVFFEKLTYIDKIEFVKKPIIDIFKCDYINEMKIGKNIIDNFINITSIFKGNLHTKKKNYLKNLLSKNNHS